MLFELLTKKSLNVTKNKNKAELIKIVLTRKLILRFLTIKADNENEIIKNFFSDTPPGIDRLLAQNISKHDKSCIVFADNTL